FPVGLYVTMKYNRMYRIGKVNAADVDPKHLDRLVSSSHWIKIEKSSKNPPKKPTTAWAAAEGSRQQPDSVLMAVTRGANDSDADNRDADDRGDIAMTEYYMWMRTWVEEKTVRDFEENAKKYSEVQATLMNGDGVRITFQKKESRGDGGVVTIVPATRLDSPWLSQTFKFILSDFEDHFFYWQCYEICRRIAQTGMVLIVGLLAGEVVALAFASLVAFGAILLHMRHGPYAEDTLDKLQLMILINQHMTQFLLAFLYMDGSNSDVIGGFMLTMQLAVGSYVIFLVRPIAIPIINTLRGRTMRMKRAVGSGAKTIVRNASRRISVVRVMAQQ
ncbi:hypothetical protein CYMTET_14998, partial [Cymbomonas tetramitiformis]